MLQSFKERMLLAQLNRDEKYAKIAILITTVFLFIIVGNVVYLNVIFFKQRASLYQASLSQEVPSESTSNLADASEASDTEPTPTPEEIVPTTQPATEVVVQTAEVKDYFVPLGSGTNQTGDWTDIPGVQAAIDFGQYKNIKEVRFEASISVSTANQAVWVRLYNVTDKHPVWNSEVTMSGGPSAYLTSNSLVWDPGIKVYQVQMKTQLKFPTQLTQSRIHVVLK